MICVICLEKKNFFGQVFRKKNTREPVSVIKLCKKSLPQTLI